MEAGKTTAWAEDNMFTTYGNARDDYHFVPITDETHRLTVSYDEIKQKVITQANDHHRVKAYTP